MTIPLFRENTESAESQSTPPPSCPSPDNNNSLLKAALNFKKQFIAGSLSSSLNPPIAAAEVAEARFDSTSAASCCGLDSSDKDVVNHHQDSGSAGGRNGFKGNYLFQKSVLLNALEKTPEREGGVVCNRAPDRPRPSCRKAATLQATDQSSSHDGSRPVYRKIIFYGPSSASVHNKRKSSCKHDQVHTLEFAKQSLLTDAKILNNHFKFCKPDLTGFDEFEFFPSPPSHPAPATTPHPPAPTHPKRIPTLNRRQAPPAPIHTKFYHFHEHKRAISESLDMVGAGLAAPFKRIQTMSPRSSIPSSPKFIDHVRQQSLLFNNNNTTTQQYDNINTAGFFQQHTRAASSLTTIFANESIPSSPQQHLKQTGQSVAISIADSTLTNGSHRSSLSTSSSTRHPLPPLPPPLSHTSSRSIGDSSNSGELDKQQLDYSRREFLVKLARSLSLYGSPSHRIEFLLMALSSMFRLPTSFVLLPGVIFLSFDGDQVGSNEVNSACRMIRVSTGYHMAKLAAVNELCFAVMQGDFSALEAMDILGGIKMSRYNLSRMGLNVPELSEFYGGQNTVDLQKQDTDLKHTETFTSTISYVLSPDRPKTPLSPTHKLNKKFGKSFVKFMERIFCCSLGNLLIFPIISFTICVTLFNGTWLEAALGALMGLVVALINTLVSSRFPQSSNLLEFVCGLVVSLLTGAIQRAGGLHAASGSISSSEETIACVGHLTIVLSGLAVLLPGLSLTSAITEISLRNMTSGTVRLFHALFTAMMLGFGISVGTIFIDGASSNSLLLQTCAHEPTSLPHGSVYPLLLLPLTLCINLFFQAPLKHWPIMMVSSAAGFSAMFVLGKVLRIDDFSSSSSTVMPVQMGVTAAAAVIGLVSNVYARWVKDADGVAAMLSGIFLLVPGSMGVRASLGFFTPTDHSNSADNNNAAAVVGAGVAEGCAFVVQMLIVGLSLTVGLFVAGILVSPVQVSVAEDHDGGPGPATDVERTETSKRKRIKKRRILSTV